MSSSSSSLAGHHITSTRRQRPKTSSRGRGYDMIHTDASLLRRSSRLSQSKDLDASIPDSSPTAVTLTSSLSQDDRYEDDRGYIAGTKKPRVSQKVRSSHIRAEPSSDSARAIDASIHIFLAKYLCNPVEDYGKAAVMQLANNGVLPRFSKYSGVVEWKNCVFLWVNIFDLSKSNDCQYPNVFTEKGRFIKWFGGSKMSRGKFHP
jgi:hypothetical protein